MKSRRQRDLEEYPEPNATALDHAVAGILLPPAAGKTQTTLRVDDDMLEWFREQALATGSAYQTAMNAALRLHMTAREGVLETLLRRVVREELDATRKPKRAAASARRRKAR